MPFDLLIADLRMPGIDGVDLTEAVRTLSPSTVVIWITAYGSQETNAKAQRLGAHRCLDKPLEVAEIRQIAREALDGADWSKYSDGKDGTGLINARYVDWTASRRETATTAQYRAHDYGRIRASDFEGGYFNKTWTAKTSTTRSRIRVALTWNSKTSAADGEPAGSVLDADLALEVYDPDGNLVAWSTTWDSNYEFVEFTPTKTGEYTIKIYGYDVPSDFWSYYGVAWTPHYDLCE